MLTRPKLPADEGLASEGSRRCKNSNRAGRIDREVTGEAGAPAHFGFERDEAFVPADEPDLRYSFDCDGDSTYEVGPQASGSASCDFPDGDALVTVGVQVDDQDGGVTTSSVLVTVHIEHHGETTRTVSAREASRTERRYYEEGE